MKIAIIGATGYTGSRILGEALDRGHHVTAIVRNTEKLPGHPNLTPAKGDATVAAELAPLLANHDAVISAFNPGNDSTGNGPRAIMDAAKRFGVRLAVVGGAGSLEVAPGKRLVDQPDFPAEWKEGSLKTSAFLDSLRAEPDLDWVFISPAAMLAPGERTGKYRIGGDEFMTDGEGRSRISNEDFAVAMIDEIETPRHRRKRFAVAY